MNHARIKFDGLLSAWAILTMTVALATLPPGIHAAQPKPAARGVASGAPRDSMASLDRELRTVQSRVEKAELALQEFVTAHPDVLLEQETRLADDLKGELDQAKFEFSTAQREAAESARQLKAGMEPWKIPPVARDAQIKELAGQLAGAEAEFAQLKLRYKSRMPVYVRTEAKVNSLKTSLQDRAHGVLLELEHKADTLEENVRRLEMAATDQAAKSRAEYALRSRYQALKSELQQQEAAYEQVLERMQSLQTRRASAPSAPAPKKSADSLARSDGTEAMTGEILQALVQILGEAPPPSVQLSTIHAMRKLGTDRVIEPLEKHVLAHPGDEVSSAALLAIAERKSPASTDALLRMLAKVSDPKLRGQIIRGLYETRPKVQNPVGSGDDVNSTPSLRVLVPAKAIAVLREIARKDPSLELRQAAIEQLGIAGSLASEEPRAIPTR